MKKSISLILVIGIVAALFTLAACGDKTMNDVTSMLDDGATMMSDIGNDISENLSEALSDESTEEPTEDITDNTTDITAEVPDGILAE